MNLYIAILFCFGLVAGVSGQGRLVDPPGRGSLWRAGYDTPINNNDNVLNCGGIQRRWETNNGKCGVCGDPWDSNPRQHELGGIYATGVITNVYEQGGVIEILADIPNPNGGFFEVSVCQISETTPDATEECLNANILTLTKNNDVRYHDIVPGENKVLYALPPDITCQHCVLRWKYRPADNYGCEMDVKTNKEVCGFGRGKYFNEYFACSDISIMTPGDLSNLQQLGDQNSLNQEAIDKASFNQSLSRQKRTVHTNFPRQTSAQPGTAPYIPFSENQNLPFTRLGKPEPEVSRVKWSWADNAPAQTFNTQPNINFLPAPAQTFNIQPNINFQPQPKNPSRLRTRNFPNNVDINRLEIGQGEMYPGAAPVPALMRVNQPVVKQMLGPGKAGGVALPPPVFPQVDTTKIQNSFVDPFNTDFGPKVSAETVNQHVMSKLGLRTKKCYACPFDQCMDKTLELDSIFPGLFEKPATFLECKKYLQLFNLGKYKLLSEGLPSCAHPRFKRQLRTISRKDDDDFGCCGTRPQVVLPLTVESDKESYNVVQLPNERNQFLVQGICGNGNTTSCSACVAESNFQWVLVYDHKVNKNPPVSFVPVKFPHYCKCLNPGRRFKG